jgi:hypothetical protein
MVERGNRITRTSGMSTWRAGCSGTGTSGSEGGSEKPTSRKAGRALRPDPYTDRDALAGALPDISGVGAVVNAAGICPPTTLADYDDETYRRVFDVNVLGTLNVIVWKLAQGTSMTGQTIVIAGGLIVR